METNSSRASFLSAIQALLILFTLFAHGAQELQTFKNCTFVPTDWADGDSFQIRTEGGEIFTVRLYGADCIEIHTKGPNDHNRLREQRRYFGITNAKKTRDESLDLALDFGQKAAELSSQLFSKPFTVYTYKQVALGDKDFIRYCSFIETANGLDLSMELIRKGLARHGGYKAVSPTGMTKEDYADALIDNELQAAKKELGIWKYTDWDKLPEERQIQSDADADDALLSQKAKPEAGFKLNPNTANRDQLMKLPGIGEKIAFEIINNRDVEYTEPKDLLRVPRIGEKTLAAILPYLDFSKK